MNAQKFHERPSMAFRLLERTGGGFLNLAVGLSGAASLPIGVFSLFVIQTNAQFSDEQFTKLAIAGTIAIFIAIIILVGIMRSLTQNLRERLGRWAQGKPLPSGKAEQDARREMTTIFWRYAIAICISFAIPTVGLNIYQYYFLKVSIEQIVYTLLGISVFVITTILITTPILEKILHPVHKILLVEIIDERLGGSRASGFQAKFQAITFGIIMISILLMAPVGYHSATTATGNPVDGLLLFNLIVFSIAVLFIGLLLSYFLSRQIFKPLHDLIETFDQVEKGNLKERAKIISVDEIGELSTSFNRMVIQLESLQQGLERRIANRTEQLRASNEVGKIASTILDPDALVAQTVNLIANTFSYYFVAIFLISDDRWAELKDATGTAGEVLKENRHRVLINDNNLNWRSNRQKRSANCIRHWGWRKSFL